MSNPPSDVLPPTQPPPDKETPMTTQLPLATNPPPPTQSSSAIIKDHGSGDHLPDPPSSACSSLSGSVTSLASGKSGIRKPSGIKPPSKISRPCAGIDKKPALPESPTKLNSSAVLTEDTDSFIIGQRVWVSGTKPGHIAFIGETQFAPGEWAGIALDEPIGKNDGSVGGIRYFQCEAKKGVFARLTRLTRFPLVQEGMGSGDTYVSSPSPVGNGIRRSPVSPTGSTRGLLRSPGAIGGSSTSITSGTSHVIDYKLEDRVIIKSSQGSKVGTVKYIGTTEFANGEWVGVELDDPRGKNDGSVNGIRYFECRPNFGLFAPVSKVSKSPSKVKPNACQVHSGTGAGLPPTGIRKVNSKESLFSNRSLISNMSMTSTSASRVRLGVNSLTPKKSAPKTTSTPLPARTAMQDLLKEKQQHIEQLLKERDIERSEITKVASEAEETERKLTALRAEYGKYRSEIEVTLQEHMNMFSQLKEDRNRLVSQLDEEKRKVEDLHFRLAETSISNEDIEVANKGHIKRIKELEEQLAKERDKTDALEREANKLFEAEENLMKSKVEIESLRKQVQEATNRQLSLEDDSVSTTVLVASLHKEIDQYKSDLDERNEMISVLKEEISKMNSETKKHVEEAVTKKTELETLCNAKDEELTRLKENLDHFNKLLQDKVTELEKIANEKLNSETALEKEINRLKMDISAKVLNLENIADSTKAKEETIATLMNEIQSLKEQLQKKSVEKEELKVELLKQIVDKDALIEQLTSSSHKQLEEIRMLKEEMEKIKQNSEGSIDELKEKFNKSVENSSNQFNTLKLEFDQKNDELFKSLENYKSLKIDFENFKKQSDEIINQKNLELTKNLENYNDLKIEFENIRKKNDEINNQRNDEFTKSSENYNNLKTELQNLKKDNDEIISQKSVELAKSIENYNDLTISFENLKKQSDELITEKNIELNNLAESLKEKDSLIQSLQLDLQTTKIDLESVSGNLKQYHTNLSDIETNLKKERDEIKETLKVKIIEMEETKKRLSEEISGKVSQLQQLTASLEQKSEEADKLMKELNNLKENHETVVRNLNDQHSKEIVEKDQKLGELRNAIEVKTKECDDAVNRTSEIEEQCRNQASEIVKLREDLENRQTENQLKSEDVSKLNENLTELKQIKINLETKNDLLEKTVKDLENNLGKQEEDISVKTNELQTIMNTLKEKDEQILSLQAEISSTKEALNKSSEDLKRYQSSVSDTEMALKKQMVDLRAILDVKNQEVEAIKTEMNVKVTESEARLNETSINLGLKNEEIEKLKNQIIDIKIDHEKYIREVTDRFKGGYGEMEEKISDLLTELENKNSDICNLNKNIVDLKNNVSETNMNMDRLKKEFEASQQQNISGDEHLTKLQENIKKLMAEKEDVMKLLQNSQELAVKVAAENDKLRNAVELLSSKIKESDEILRTTTKQLEENQQTLLTAKTDYEKKIESLEGAIKKLEQAVKDQEDDFNKQKLEYEDIIKTAYESEEALKDLLTSNKDPEKIHELEKNLEGIKSNLDARDKLLSERNNEISKLREELKKAKSQQISNGSVDTVQPNPVQVNQNPDYQQLLEDKIFAESQVSFLNSIIVDMQKKNEEQKARIEILEMGYSASAADELVALGFKSEVKTPAPRMYCDICEEFDLHETEDCPTQGEDEQPLVNPHLEGMPKHKPPPRPYCDICGEFGHATEDCTVDHEF